MAILLDTSAYSLINRNNRELFNIVKFAPEILMSPAVLAELQFGFMRGTRRQSNLDRLEQFLAAPRVKIVPISADTADRYARIRMHLLEQGTPIPMNDIWIAASALEYSAELITADKHFRHVPLLKIRQITR